MKELDSWWVVCFAGRTWFRWWKADTFTVLDDKRYLQDRQLLKQA